MTVNLKDAQLALSRAKIRMLKQHPFYGYILTKLKFEWNDHIPSSCTDGLRIEINPEYFMKQTPGEQMSTLAHEQMHNLDGYFNRIPNGDSFQKNIAHDVFIHNVLKAEGFATLQDNEKFLNEYLGKLGGWTCDMFCGHTFEQIYHHIHQKNKSNPQPQQSPQSQPGDGDGDRQGQSGVSDGESGEQPDKGKLTPLGCMREPGSDSKDGNATGAKQKQAEQWKQLVREAGQFASGIGAEPGYWQNLVKAAQPEVSFESHLYEFLKRGVGGEATFDHLNRRALAYGEYMPSETKEVMGETICVVDTSGSIVQYEKLLPYILGLIRDWRDKHNCKFHIVDCDTEIRQWRTFEETDELPTQVKFGGGGGTDFDPIFESFRTKAPEAQLIIYVTDGEGRVNKNLNPHIPVLWVLAGPEASERFAPAFGQVTRIKAKPRSHYQ